MEALSFAEGIYVIPSGGLFFIKVELLKLPLPMKVQKFGFQDQEDEAILRNRGAQRRYYYVSTAGFGRASYSTSN